MLEGVLIIILVYLKMMQATVLIFFYSLFHSFVYNCLLSTSIIFYFIMKIASNIYSCSCSLTSFLKQLFLISFFWAQAKEVTQ